nr:hypothetical protein [uncultured Noviherbaspirillum sp.]
MPSNDSETYHFASGSDQSRRFDPRSPVWGTIGYAILSAIAIGMVLYLTFAA